MSQNKKPNLTALSPEFVWDGPGWAPKEQHHFLHDRPWQVVHNFWQRLVQGQACLSSLGLAPAGQPPAAGTAPAGQHLPWAPASPGPAAAGQDAQGIPAAKPGWCKPDGDRTTWKVQVAYLGPGFRGWAAQAGCREAAAASIGVATTPASKPEGGSVSPPQASCCSRDLDAQHQHHEQQQAGVALVPGQALTAAEGPPHSSPASVVMAATRDSQGGTAAGSRPAAELLLSVEGVLGAALAGLAGGRAPRLSVGGRTDKGVSAAAQLVSFFTCARPVTPDQVAGAINQAVPGALRAVSVTQVPRSYHATFSTTWRRYVYLIPMRCSCSSNMPAFDCSSSSSPFSSRSVTGAVAQAAAAGATHHSAVDSAVQAKSHQVVSGEFCLPTLQHLLQQLEGRELDCFAFARDTVQGKGTACTLYTARATLQHLPAINQGAGCSSPSHILGPLSACTDAAFKPPSVAVEQQQQRVEEEAQQEAPASQAGPAHCMVCAAAMLRQQPVVVVELAGNRFLRKMVRVLLSTAVREAMSGAAAAPQEHQHQALLYLAQQRDRRSTAIPAPAVGLCFAAAG